MLVGIARHAFSKAPMELLAAVDVTLDGGLHGDFRGAVKPGGRGKRQVTMMERVDWDAAMAELGHAIPWQERRVNLLLDGIDIPQLPGTRIAIGDAEFEVTVECDPCSRMETVAAGLKAALTPDWRGGACTRVRVPGRIAVGDTVTIRTGYFTHEGR
ncbi:MOSC domain-containing protein YiiM [Sphingomonas insulae]|nr:MOSC domain-containing protein YiiM [Sphingomonas insulae]